MEELYPAAFPDEDLLGLLRDLHAATGDVVSLIAEVGGRMAGNVVLSACRVDGQAARVDLLGPLAVTPDLQRSGVGSALVKASVANAAARGASAICVLGDPAYYGRLGFRQAKGLTAPYPFPDEWLTAWQYIGIGSEPCPHGRLMVPPPWQNAAYWS